MTYELRLPLGMPLRPHRQTFAARGAMFELDPARIGDCFRACIASLLDTQTLADVPHFVAQRALDEYLAGIEMPWHDLRLARDWLRSDLDLDLASVERSDLDDLDLHYVATVPSHGGPWSHAVIARHGAVVHDPSNSATPYTLDGADPAGLALALPYDPPPDELFEQWRLAELDELVVGDG